MSHQEVTLGEVAKFFANAHPPDYPIDGFIRRPHCEACGVICSPMYEDGHLVAYVCPSHGPLTHDALVWVYHER